MERSSNKNGQFGPKNGHFRTFGTVILENLNFLAGTVNSVYKNGHFSVTKPSLFKRGIQLKIRFFVNYFVKYRSILPFNSKKRPDRMLS